MTRINSNEALLILTKWSDGSVFLMETEARPYSAPEVQHLIDSTVSANCSVTSVRVLELDTGASREITDDFDIPEVPGFVGAYRPTQYNAIAAE